MTNENKKELTLVKTFDASLEQVWKTWTDPKLIAQWWGPYSVSIPVCEFEARPNGKIHIVMEAGEEMGPVKGTQWPMTGIIKEIDEPARLVFTSINMTDAAGKPTFESLNTVTFEEVDGKTKVTVQIKVIKFVESGATSQAITGMEQGWQQTLEKLGKFLA